MSRRRASDITRWMSIGAGVTGLLVLGLAVSLLWPESAARHAAPVALLAGDPARLSTAPGSGRPASAPTASPTAVAPAKATSSTDEASPAGASSVATTPLQAAGASIEAYRGLGSWVDIYDARAWADPRAVIADLSGHGVRTLYVETGNSASDGTVFDPKGQAAFITAAHERGMRVVAWYLPSLTDVGRDYARIASAIALRDSGGRGFDSFALDIESDSVKPTGERNGALLGLSRRIRSLVGSDYPLGAIIPAPVGMRQTPGYWDDFPYRQLAGTYDVIVPMAYYTYHGDGAASARQDSRDDMRILRAQPGCATIPVHLVGGVAEDSTPAELAAFLTTARETGCIGASLYGWAATTPSDWRALRAVSNWR